MPEPMWNWCPLPGPSRDTKLVVDINNYGDGYVHRSTRGLNPVRPSWSLQFPFESAAEFAQMNDFLSAYAAPGFYFTPPDGGGATVFVTTDQWTATTIDRYGTRTSADKIVGTLAVTFERAFNPQPTLLPLPDPDVWAWGQAVVAAGGTVSGARLNVVSDFVRAEKAAGTWARTDEYWLLWAENHIQARVSLKRRVGPMGFDGGPVFTVDRGYTFNGTNYLGTTFIPSTHATVMTATNCRLASYERTNLGDSSVNCGCSSGTPLMQVGPRSNTTNIVAANLGGSNIIYTLLAPDSRRLTAVSRNGNTVADHRCYKEGVSLAFSSGAPTFPATLPTVSLFIGGRNNSGVLQNGRASQVGFVTIGGWFTAAQEAAQWANVQALATAIGAQV